MNRSGTYITQPTGYKSFKPSPLPPEPALMINEELSSLLTKAERSLARMNGIAHTLPDSNLFIAMYVRKEALLSSQIEGTQASLEDVFEVESGKETDNINDVEEVINYIKALNYGIERLEKFPMSLRFIKEVHKILMTGVRGQHKSPGDFRISQNWIGGSGGDINNAIYIPPSVDDMKTAMSDFEKYMHENKLADLIDCALLHYQFETIHPFLDGNGRIGRLLITLFLYWKNIISKPLLYLSLYLKQNRQEYYDRLSMVRNNGDYEQWVNFFLKGLIQTAESGLETIKKILTLQNDKKKLLWKNKLSSPYAIGILDFLFTNPYVSIKDIEKQFFISFQSASTLVGQFEKIGILKENTGRKRDQKFLFKEYVDILKVGT